MLSKKKKKRSIECRPAKCIYSALECLLFIVFKSPIPLRIELSFIYLLHLNMHRKLRLEIATENEYYYV